MQTPSEATILAVVCLPLVLEKIGSEIRPGGCLILLSCVLQKKKEQKIWRLTIIELPDLGDRCGLQTFSSSFQDNRVLTQYETKPYRSTPSDEFRSRLPLQRGECKRRAIQATTLCVCPPCVGENLLRNSPPLVCFLASASTFVRGGVFSYAQY